MASQAATPKTLDPGETRLFANLMQGVPTPPAGTGGGPSTLHDAAQAYASQFSGNVRTVDVQMTRLRRKIERDPKFPRYLQTVRGTGYVLKPD